MTYKFWWGHRENDSKIHWMSSDWMGFSKAQGGMRFWDLVMFIKALLTKQCWRLLQHLDSLATKIIKAKYFPQSIILKAHLGKCPSFVWKSLLLACDLLKNGLIWRVGDGKDIWIWGDIWFPTPISVSVQSPRQILADDARMANLIDQDTKWWNLNLISKVFQEEEAWVIRQIPLSPQQPRDLLIWRCTTNDNFIVRSAYHMGKEMQLTRQGGSSKRRDDDTVWKAIWNLKTPNVVKMFIWRACNNFLPTNKLIQTGCTSWCSMSYLWEVTIIHIL